MVESEFRKTKTLKIVLFHMVATSYMWFSSPRNMTEELNFYI